MLGMDNFILVQHMTASFMHFYKKTDFRRLFATLLTGSFVVFMLTTAYAAVSNLHIRNAELVPTEDSYLLNADFDVTLSPTVEEALNKGIPLTFLIEFQLTSPRRYWFDDEIATVSTYVTLSYHALSRQYLVNLNNHHQRSFASLQDAKQELSRLEQWPVFEKALLKKGEAYKAALRVRLDQTKLPKALQVDVIGGSEDWNMVSQRYRWVPTLF